MSHELRPLDPLDLDVGVDDRLPEDLAKGLVRLEPVEGGIEAPREGGR